MRRFITNDFFIPAGWTLLLLVCLLGDVFSSCQNKQSKGLFVENDSILAVREFDLPEIENAGELIAVTLSGPDTYFEYRGREMGVQYALAENFANSIGLRLRMEIASDTVQLLQMLLDAKADLVALPLRTQGGDFLSCGPTAGKDGERWLVRRQSGELAAAINDWYKPDKMASLSKGQQQMMRAPRVSRRAQAVYLNRSSGVISHYDPLFQRYAGTAGMDWRMLAAISYQESGFDPEATSWAGARGLMQLMPRTAASLGVSANQITNPEVNVSASARYLKQLTGQFSDIRNPQERQKFVLAAYNGGAHHVRDAMALARKNRRSDQKWDQVSYFVLHLSQSAFYRDPVVKHGYMIGSETYHYVYRILDLYADYCGVARPVHPSVGTVLPQEAPREAPPKRVNRFTKKNNSVANRDSILNRINRQ